METLYPPIEPYGQGTLSVGDGHNIYWEVCGNPHGKSAVVLHGGPGAGCTPGSRRPFNPDAYRIILFDQRGCGRSTPHASVPDADLSTNSTEHLLADIELLREHLEVEKWLVFGGSWGSTLALAYAERHPDRVSELVLVAVTTTTRWEVDWITEGIGQFFPEALDRFRNGLPEAEGGEPLVDAYHRMLMSPDPEIHNLAARNWCDWEIAIVNSYDGYVPSPRYESPEFRLAFARIVTHYFRNAAWLKDGQLLREIEQIAQIPAVLIHGRLDLTSPLIIPWRLAQAWPACRLDVLTQAGHSGGLGMTDSLVRATNQFVALGPSRHKMD